MVREGDVRKFPASWQEALPSLDDVLERLPMKDRRRIAFTQKSIPTPTFVVDD
jgi:hypothetical protein